MSITAGFVDRLKAYISISDLVSKQVKLTKKGKDYFGRCPFHSEQTPSFSVNNAKRFYHCFGCGASGDIIDFVEKTRNLDFQESVKYLAKEYNLALPEADEKPYQGMVALEQINAVASKWFYRNLYSSQSVEYLRYLHDRGIGNEYLKEFFLGYAPDSKKDLINHLKSLGYQEKDIRTSGLVTELDNGEIIDKFRKRLMFPIANTRGKIIGFGGRAMADIQPKYLNSPETEIFRKREVLYNENKLFKELRDSKEVYVVEGYTDAIAMYMSGIKNTVATLGTAISEYHIQKLWKISEVPTICMDGDAAGMRAMARSINVVLPILKPGYSINFVKLPDGMDPDDVIKSQGGAHLRKILEQKIDLCEAIWNLNISNADLRTPETQALLKKKLIDIVNQIQDVSVKQFYHKYFNDKIFALFSKARKNPKAISINESETIGVLDFTRISAIEKYALTLLAIVIDSPYVLLNHKIHEEFFAIDLKSEYIAKIHRVISDVFAMMDESKSEDEFNNEFVELLKEKLASSVIKFLSGEHSYFLDKISVKNINNVVTCWNKTISMYNLELLKVDYIKSLQVMEEDSAEISGMLKKQITEQEKHIKNNSN